MHDVRKRDGEHWSAHGANRFKVRLYAEVEGEFHGTILAQPPLTPAASISLPQNRYSVRSGIGAEVSVEQGTGAAIVVEQRLVSLSQTSVTLTISHSTRTVPRASPSAR